MNTVIRMRAFAIFISSYLRRVGVVLLLSVTSLAYGQLKSSATIVISARLPGYVRTTVGDMPFILDVHNGTSSTIELPIEVTWNLNPRESQAFRVVASFRGTGLIETQTRTLAPASVLEARIGQAELRPFDGTNLVLWVRTISTSNRQGSERAILQLRMEQSEGLSFQDGKYYGLLHIEAEPL